MASYELTRKAAADLRGIYRYGFREHGKARATHYKRSLDAQFQKIADEPLRFPKTGFRDSYRYSVHQPYTIYFRLIDANRVQIVRILRGQDPRQTL